LGFICTRSRSGFRLFKEPGPGSGSGSRPRFLMTKNVKILTVWGKKFILFDHKLQYEGLPSSMRSIKPSKTNIQLFKTANVVLF
jgi:hypothetical protein